MAIQTTCCVVGGGPAGMMLGWLLARRGVRVIVLEKHGDFFRDFRGDTVHTSTLEIMHELGVLDDFLKVPHQKVTRAGGVFGDFEFAGADFRTLPTHCKFVALMPQWDFLDFVAAQARKESGFELRMQHEVFELIKEDGKVVGVLARTPESTIEVRADLVVGCDGRHSTVRKVAGLPVLERGVPIDVLWFRLPRHESDPEQVLGIVNYGKVLILINRGDYFQAGLVIRKDSYPAVQQAGIEAFRNGLVRMAPFLNGRVQVLKSWDDIKLLSVQINRLKKWFTPGLLCIGDAAHAVSPVGGVGINVAIQDAVAAAKILAGPLLHRRTSSCVLRRVQRRRELPVRMTQAMQLGAHHLLATGVFPKQDALRAPWQFRLAVRIPVLRRIAARAIGLGFRTEHVHEHRDFRAGTLRRVAVAAGVTAAVAVMALRVLKRGETPEGRRI